MSEKENFDMAAKFLELADEAWWELLKDKIKEKILASKGGELDKLADMISKANGERWHSIIEGKKRKSEFQKNIEELFGA